MTMTKVSVAVALELKSFEIYRSGADFSVVHTPCGARLKHHGRQDLERIVVLAQAHLADCETTS